MRMVIEVPEQLHAAVKERAAAEGRPMSQAVRQLLENYVGHVELVAVSVDKKPGLVPGTGVLGISKKDQAKGRTRK